MAVFILETDNPSRRIIRSLLYISSINMGRTTTSILKVRPEEESKTVGRGGGYSNIIILAIRIYVPLETVWFSSHLLWDRVQ